MVFRFFAPKAPEASVPYNDDRASFPVKNLFAKAGKPGSKFPVYTEGEIVEGKSGEILGVRNPKFKGVEVNSLNEAKMKTGSEYAFFAFMPFQNNPQHEIEFVGSGQSANLIYVEAPESETPSQSVATMGGRKRRTRRKKTAKKIAKKSRKHRRRTY